VKPSKLFYALIATIVLLHAAAATADGINMDDPRRTVGREDNVRIDAQLVQDTVSPGTPIGVAYQIENLSATPVAVADKVAAATYDQDTRTITLSIGSEVPDDGKMPHIVTIPPGEKKLFRTGATPMLGSAATRSPLAAPRYVQVKVSILRDLAPFARLSSAQTLSDEQFDKWFEANDTIFLNAVPVRFSTRRNSGFASADQRSSGGGM
jgi:hypothetical protein